MEHEQWRALARALEERGAMVRWQNQQRLCFSPPASEIRFIYDGIELMVSVRGEVWANKLAADCRTAMRTIEELRAQGIAIGPRPALTMQADDAMAALPLRVMRPDVSDPFAHVDD